MHNTLGLSRPPHTPNTHVTAHVHTHMLCTDMCTHAHRHSVAAAAREPIFNKMRVHVNDPMPLRERKNKKKTARK